MLARGQREGRGQRGEHAAGDRLGVGVRGHLVAQHGERVAAEAGDRVRRAHHAAAAARRRGEERVARGVAERVVDELEAVEGEAEDGELAAGAGQAGEGVGDAVRRAARGWAGRSAGRAARCWASAACVRRRSTAWRRTRATSSASAPSGGLVVGAGVAGVGGAAAAAPPARPRGTVGASSPAQRGQRASTRRPRGTARESAAGASGASEVRPPASAGVAQAVAAKPPWRPAHRRGGAPPPRRSPTRRICSPRSAGCHAAEVMARYRRPAAESIPARRHGLSSDHARARP